MKTFVAGVLAAIGTQCVLVAALSRFVPASASVAPFARMAEGFAPWLLLLGLAVSVMLLLLRAMRSGTLLSVASLAAAAHLYANHHSQSQPLAAEEKPDITLLFFNALRSNTGSGERIVESVLAANPDIFVIVERQAVEHAIEKLRGTYEFISPCAEDACEVLVASKKNPLRFWQLQLNPAWGARYAVAEFNNGDEQTFFLAASQIAKPWHSGFVEIELERLAAQYNWINGPVVAVGDFNATPWSYPMRNLMARTGMKALRAPPGTWPVGAGRFGFPIDQIMTRGGIHVTDIRSFGQGLGSNHLGFAADISLP